MALPRGLSRGIAGDWNQALMELGATVCRPAPACGECPLRDACHAYAEAEVSYGRKCHAADTSSRSPHPRRRASSAPFASPCPPRWP